MKHNFISFTWNNFFSDGVSISIKDDSSDRWKRLFLRRKVWDGYWLDAHRLEAHSNTCCYITFILLCIKDGKSAEISSFLGHECVMLCFVYLADEEEQKGEKDMRKNELTMNIKRHIHIFKRQIEMQEHPICWPEYTAVMGISTASLLLYIFQLCYNDIYTWCYCGVSNKKNFKKFTKIF